MKKVCIAVAVIVFLVAAIWISLKLTPNESEPLNVATQQKLVSDYVNAHISELSPTKEILGGKFYITKIEYPEQNRVHVEYEDGHIALKADANYAVDKGNVQITGFTEQKSTAEIIADLFSKKYNHPASTYIIKTSIDTGGFAKGTVNYTDRQGGGVWFAAKNSDGWQLAFDGNGIIPCTASNRYNFPAGIIPQCIDTENNNKIMTRN